MTSLIIPGWPSPTTEQVELFQANNELVVDGIVGPKTKAAANKPAKERGPFVDLAWHPIKVGGDPEAEQVARLFFMATPLAWALPTAPAMMTVTKLLTSGWKTGRFYSTQDGATFGLRRYAARTLRRFVKENPIAFRRYLGEYWLHRVSTELADAPNNGGLAAEPAVRLGLMNAARDWGLFERQLVDVNDYVRKTLKPYPRWRDARTIALACRAANSSPRWIEGAPKKDGDAWAFLVKNYSNHKRGPSRIRRICKEIPEGTKWK